MFVVQRTQDGILLGIYGEAHSTREEAEKHLMRVKGKWKQYTFEVAEYEAIRKAGDDAEGEKA